MDRTRTMYTFNGAGDVFAPTSSSGLSSGEKLGSCENAVIWNGIYCAN